MNQTAIFKLTLTLGRNHPDMYDEFMKMSQREIAEFVNVTYGTNLQRGTGWEEVNTVTSVMDKMFNMRNTSCTE